MNRAVLLTLLLGVGTHACSGASSDAPPPPAVRDDAGAGGGGGGGGGTGPGGGGPGGNGPAADAGPTGFLYKPVAEGCITDVTPGEHTFTCEGLPVAVTIPDMAARCQASGCGLIVELHGDTGTGPTFDVHMRLRARGPERGYIVLAPTGPAIGRIGAMTYPGSTWGPAADDKLVAITQLFAKVFRPDAKRVFATGFSRGGFATWRMACDHSDLFAAFAIGGAGNQARQLTVNQPERTCFNGADVPPRRVDILMLIGQLDRDAPGMRNAREQVLVHMGRDIQDATLVKEAIGYRQERVTMAGGPTLEWFEHSYVGDRAGTNPNINGHCIPGSTVPASTPEYSVACKPPTAFDWGQEVLAFFDAHPRP